MNASRSNDADFGACRKGAMAVCVLTIMCTGVDKTATSTKARLKDKNLACHHHPLSLSTYPARSVSCTITTNITRRYGGQVNVRKSAGCAWSCMPRRLFDWYTLHREGDPIHSGCIFFSWEVGINTMFQRWKSLVCSSKRRHIYVCLSSKESSFGR